MLKRELKKGKLIQDTRTKEKYRIISMDCYGIAYAQKCGCAKTICVGGALDKFATENCRYFEEVI